MKITKTRLKQIIREELQEAYETLPGGGLQWHAPRRSGSGQVSSPLVKKLFYQIKKEMGLSLSRDDQLAAMIWIDGNWRNWDTLEAASEAIKQWLAELGA